MTESVDRTYDMLQRIGEFLKKLSQEQYDALVAGEARLEVVLKGARVSGGGAKKAAPPAALPVSADQVAADLRNLDDRQSATRYLEDLKLGKPQLVLLAHELNVKVTTKQTMAQIRDLIVAQKVGSRLTTDAILGRR
ncbi:hypothetical protein RB614_41605 [Phytohabitans sp. ZYX-F-186]|uniref:Uncharacterized protein n=1 Tax=Phytohabitans maris TaxID=3071409 RepID=A0ABU0ZXH3_9ACTN|nr:hypothetical protein [Phytohabitans sp. ZYX-F-186]MDQ7911004.1 hypothetical protein [Phytohabitans sp. ZYX-F-186]